MQGQVLSVNVGAVREIVYRGRPRATAIYKEPVTQRLKVFPEHLEGDHQADLNVHGGRNKALYAYAFEDYEWWSAELGQTLGPGTFGENLTTTGIDLSGLRIGEQVRAGTALLAVTQPRFPCWKLGFRMGTQKFPRRFLEAERAGAYFSVIEEGEIGTGDALIAHSRPDHPVTIGLIAHLNHADHALGQMLLDAANAGLGQEDWQALLAQIGAQQ